MRRLSPLEKLLLILSAAMILCGLWLVNFPRDMSTVIPGNSARGRNDNVAHKFSKEECRVLGGLAVALGFGLAWIAIYPLKK